MDIDSDVCSDNLEQLQVEETDDSNKVNFIGEVPHTRDTDGSTAAECINGDWSDEVKQENLALVKQEPDNVCYLCYVLFVTATTICVVQDQFLCFSYFLIAVITKYIRLLRQRACQFCIKA